MVSTIKTQLGSAVDVCSGVMSRRKAAVGRAGAAAPLDTAMEDAPARTVPATPPACCCHFGANLVICMGWLNGVIVWYITVSAASNQNRVWCINILLGENCQTKLSKCCWKSMNFK